MEYVIFRCTECDAIVAYPNRTADGRRCSECKEYKGFTVPIDKGTKQELIGRHGDSIAFNGMQTKKTSKKTIDITQPIFATDKFDGSIHRVTAIYFPLGSPSGKDITIDAGDGTDEWRSIDEVVLETTQTGQT